MAAWHLEKILLVEREGFLNFKKKEGLFSSRGKSLSLGIGIDVGEWTKEKTYQI